ncbi:MAG: MotA/TolQ/ExbB proton channel family protein [Thermodesulfobacteriota bacterium]|nr:MotA/TolQ/ExbB proton channel family protein [Thermodesulfobacteriota bacterium]
METFLGLFRSHATLASTLIQFAVYTTSALLFLNGLWISLKAFRWLRRVDDQTIEGSLSEVPYADDPVVMIVAKTVSGDRRDPRRNAAERLFLADATRQMAENMFESRYMEPLTMFASLLPPLGFIGTVFGMILIFLVKVDPGSELSTIGLGAALFTTLAALILFVVLEIIKLWLLRLFRDRVDKGLSFVPGGEEK